jgi:hypothetical protein
LPSLLLGDDVFEIWVVGFVGFDGVGAECVDADAFMGVIAIPRGIGLGDLRVSLLVFGFLDD